jgi:hypothetical protein
MRDQEIKTVTRSRITKCRAKSQLTNHEVNKSSEFGIDSEAFVFEGNDTDRGFFRKNALQTQRMPDDSSPSIKGAVRLGNQWINKFFKK